MTRPMTEARRQQVHGKLISAIADDATWQPAYRSFVAAVLTVWAVAGALALVVGVW